MIRTDNIYIENLIYRWQERNLESSWNFNQMQDPNRPDVNATVYITEHKEVIANAMLNAFHVISGYIGYFPRPTYVENTIIKLEKTDLYNNRKTFSLPTRHLHAIGTEKRERIGEFTLTLNTEDPEEHAYNISLGDDFAANELKFFFRDEDNAAGPANDFYTIPFYNQDFNPAINNTINSATIHKSYLAKPRFPDFPFDNYGNIQALDINDNDTFVTQIDAYRIHTDPSKGVRILFRQLDENNNIIIHEENVKSIITSHHFPEFQIQWPETSIEGTPFALKINYLAGLPLEDNYQMNTVMEKAIISLANIDPLLLRLPVSTRTNTILSHDRTMPLDTRGRMPAPYHNPLGLTNAHIQTWRNIAPYIDTLLGYPI